MTPTQISSLQNGDIIKVKANVVQITDGRLLTLSRSGMKFYYSGHLSGYHQLNNSQIGFQVSTKELEKEHYEFWKVKTQKKTLPDLIGELEMKLS